MISSTFGAPFGGATRGGHQGFDSSALRSISPPNGSAGAGSTSPGMVRVALGDVPFARGGPLCHGRSVRTSLRESAGRDN